ncbi:hypothetical protein [Nocardioides iriomotensis]|uniref:DUF4386 family protein n=1 Tax=Nocardioides iriomotensis TaxID=715784 RepID=A0A4Q5IWW7_9ACTN|nr:hypothetical protein [Nocardioides iriomotensis]RYU09349.1 hypothetical protein ETU37_19940 [Nocardioides iriomotensis]
MSTHTAHPAHPAGTTTQEGGRVTDPSRPMRWAAGIALLAAPLLWSAGMVTSPEQASMADADYVSSLARNLTQTEVSALFLHYGNLFIGLGILAAPTLVRGRRGSRLVVVGSLLAALGFTNVSGMILSDWWNMSIGTLLPIDQAAEVFAMFKASDLLWIWNGTEMLSLVGPLLLLAGLARSGVLGWYTLALMVGGVAGLMFIPVSLPWATAIAVLVGFSPFALVGLRIVQRLRVAG